MIFAKNACFVLGVLALACGDTKGAERGSGGGGSGGASSGGLGGAAGVSTAGGGAAGSDAGADDYIHDCKSLFAARVAEKAREKSAKFPADCNAKLGGPVGDAGVGAAFCHADESPNECQARLYATPPPISELAPGCPSGGNCLRALWVPRCADGSDSCGEPEAICQDGTRPMAYADSATAGVSNRWIFYLSGEGGPCNGDTCWANYHFAHTWDEPVFERAMSSLHPDYPTPGAETGTGITNGTLNAANPLTEFNRIKWKRCSDYASDADETVVFGDGVGPMAVELGAPPASRTSQTQVHHRGFKTWLALLHSLTTAKGRDLDGDSKPDLPSLSDATEVLLAGSSDASLGLVFVADRLAEELATITGKKAKVRILIDGYFDPSLDNERRYQPDAPPNFNALANAYHAGDACVLPDDGDGVSNEKCSNLMFKPGVQSTGTPTQASVHLARGTLLDQSCEALHGVGAPECYDRFHTLVHHVATAFTVVADREDGRVGVARVALAEEPSYRWSGPEVYGERTLAQAEDIRNFWPSAAREEGPGAPGLSSIMLRKSRRNGQPWTQANHTHFDVTSKMQWTMTQCAGGKKLASVTIADFVAGKAAESFVIENVALGTASSFWVTGDVCKQPE